MPTATSTESAATPAKRDRCGRPRCSDKTTHNHKCVNSARRRQLFVGQRGRPHGLPQCGHCNYRTVRIAMAISVADRRLRTWAGAPEGIAPYVTFTMAHSPK